MLALLTVLLLPAISLAQTPLPTAGEAMGRTTETSASAPETTYDFETDHVEGNIIRPLGESVGGEWHPNTSSLIRVRANFVDEMLKSVEDI